MKFREAEWDVMIAAYAYEVLDEPTLPDSTYDGFCKLLNELGTSIPGFDASTGQWIHELIKDKDILSVLDIAARKTLEMGAGTSCHHVIPSEYIIGRVL